MASRDDMVLRPDIKVRKSVRQRAKEERIMDAVRKKAARPWHRLRNRLRSQIPRVLTKTPRGARTAPHKSASKGIGRSAAAGAARAVGYAFLAAEAVIEAGRLARRSSGQSTRLIDATDSYTLYGNFPVDAQAKSRARDFIEQYPWLLEHIGDTGVVGPGVMQLAKSVESMERKGLLADQRLDLAPDLDAPETATDAAMVELARAKEWFKSRVREVRDAYRKAKGSPKRGR